MKRAAMNFQDFNAMDEEAKAKLLHQTLLGEYLKLQKEFVSKKRKFRTAKQKRDTLVGIVKFLRHRRRYLLSCRSMTTELERDLVKERSVLEVERKLAANEAAMRSEEGGEGRRQGKVVRKASRSQKMPRNYLIEGKTALGKKKVSWHDQLTLKV